MKTIAPGLFLVFICCACSRGKYNTTNVFRKGEAGNMRSIVLDSTYHFYLREVYKYKNLQAENMLTANVEKNNTDNKTRIEVEYLLLSRVYKNVVYISTIPDKFQRHYSSNIFADTLINAYDFSTFHFGKIAEDGESISFNSTGGKKTITWDIRPFILADIPKKISIREISVQRKDMVENVILINKALEEPLTFTCKDNFAVIFEKAGNKRDTCYEPSSLCKLSDQRIYFSRAKRGYDVYLRFDKNIGNSKDSAIYFDERRTRYPPYQQ